MPMTCGMESGICFSGGPEVLLLVIPLGGGPSQPSNAAGGATLGAGPSQPSNAGGGATVTMRGIHSGSTQRGCGTAEPSCSTAQAAALEISATEATAAFIGDCAAAWRVTVDARSSCRALVRKWFMLMTFPSYWVLRLNLQSLRLPQPPNASASEGVTRRPSGSSTHAGAYLCGEEPKKKVIHAIREVQCALHIR